MKRARIQQSGVNEVTLTEPDGTVRHFWAPLGGGYVREISHDRPGTLGRQVCDGLRFFGNALDVRDPSELLSTIRAHWPAYRKSKSA